MSQGLPPQPTCRHMAGGFFVFIFFCLAVLALPNVVKWVGAVLTFIPGQLSLVEVVRPDEVAAVSMLDNPTVVEFDEPGQYALFTLNYDLLVINDAVVAAGGKPWLRLVGTDGREVKVTLVARGMALFDTPYAKGRPVALFTIDAPGAYTMFHPARDDMAYIVPDYTTGRETGIAFWMLLQVGVLAGGVWYLYTARAMRRLPRTIPRPTAASRTNYVRDLEEQRAIRLERSPADNRPWIRQSAASPASSPQEESPERDVLAQLKDRRITLQQAEAEVDAALMSQTRDSSDWRSRVGLSQPEAAAYSQGASLMELVGFRQAGWPNECAKCGRNLELQQMRWWFVRDSTGTPQLRHIDCPPAEPT